MSYVSRSYNGTALGDVETLTGDVGGAVGVDAAYNINILGGVGTTITGNPATNTLTIDSLGLNQDQVIYVGKHGNDANDGRTIEKAKLTFQNAIDTAVTVFTSDAVVWCFDDGPYVENLTGAVWISIYAPNAHIIGAHTIRDACRWVFGHISNGTGGTTAITLDDAADSRAGVYAKTFSVSGGATNCFLNNQGYLFINIESFVFNSTGTIVTTITGARTDFKFNTIEMIANGGTVLNSSGGLISVLGNAVYNTGVGNGTLVVSSGAGIPEIYGTITEVNLETFNNITGATICNMNIARMLGSMNEAGAGNAFVGGATRIDGVGIGSVTPATGQFTTLGATTSLTVDIFTAGVVQSSAAGLFSSSNGTNGQVLIGGAATPTWANVTSSLGSVSITNGAGTINLESSGVAWSNITDATVALEVGRGYFLNRAGGVIATLPTTATAGQIIEIAITGTGAGQIAQNASQQIHFGTSSTTVGVGGSVTSTNQYDTLKLVCIAANTEFLVLSSVGNWSIV